MSIKLEIEIVKEDGRNLLKFDPDPRRRWILLKLLDDDYLNSDMTDRHAARPPTLQTPHPLPQASPLLYN